MQVGWQTVERVLKGPKTSGKFLLPIAAKVTNFKTIWLHLTYIQEMAKFVNSKYVSVVMYMGAAIDANKIIWNFPEKFGNIVIQTGDFHLMKKTSR